MQFFGGQAGESPAQVMACLAAEDGKGSLAGAVGSPVAVSQDIAHQIEVGVHIRDEVMERPGPASNKGELSGMGRFFALQPIRAKGLPPWPGSLDPAGGPDSQTRCDPCAQGSWRYLMETRALIRRAALPCGGFRS